MSSYEPHFTQQYLGLRMCKINLQILPFLERALSLSLSRSENIFFCSSGVKTSFALRPANCLTKACSSAGLNSLSSLRSASSKYSDAFSSKALFSVNHLFYFDVCKRKKFNDPNKSKFSISICVFLIFMTNPLDWGLHHCHSHKLSRQPTKQGVPIHPRAENSSRFLLSCYRNLHSIFCN